MGLGKKVARAKRELSDIKNEAVAELMAARERDRVAYEEIARRLDCPIGTVRSRIFRAREAIDQVLKPLLETGKANRERGHA